jgi:hypothetical protein
MSVFGREFLVRALVCNIASDSVPDTTYRIQAVTLPPVDHDVSWWQVRFQLRHFIYDHPVCVDEIIRWLRRVP